MRFAYIDSHGNEVPIPSVDALALRIELGAVGPDTQLYDAQADHWGPAKTHEIFHTLSRDVGEQEGFVAPPPPVAPPPEPPREKEPPAKKPAAEKPAKPKPKLKKPEKKGAKEAKDLGLTLAEAAPGAPADEDKAESTADGFGELDLSMSAPGESAPAAAPPAAAEPAGGTFDFGDLGSGLELEPTSAGGGADQAPMDLSPAGGGGGGDLVLETPMSEFTPDAPPGWMEESGGPAEDVMDFSTVSAETAADEPMAAPVLAPAGDRRAPKDRPSKPKFKRQRSLSGPIVMVVLLLALGVGGYVGWPILQARLSRPEPPVRPAVVMPPISPELMPRMQELTRQAIADVVARVDGETSPAGAPSEPVREWLAGIYLGNASQFASVEAFWTAVGRFVDGLRAGEWQAYHDALESRANGAGLSGEDVAIVLERADSGFVAAEEQRLAAYDAMERLVVASLDLHDFLLENEANIEYRPAIASTADPVLQAVPSTPAIGDRMWEMVEEITESLDALGSLDRVTRERLTSAMRTRLQEDGVR